MRPDPTNMYLEPASGQTPVPPADGAKCCSRSGKETFSSRRWGPNAPGRAFLAGRCSVMLQNKQKRAAYKCTHSAKIQAFDVVFVALEQRQSRARRQVPHPNRLVRRARCDLPNQTCWDKLTTSPWPHKKRTTKTTCPTCDIT